MDKSKNKKAIKVCVAIICCISIVIGTIFGVFKFFSKDDDKKSYNYAYSEYNSFSEGFTNVLVTDEKSALEAVASISHILGISDVAKELKVVSVNNVKTDSYYRMQQYYNGIPVYGSNIVISVDEDKKATALTSNFIPFTSNVSLKPTAKQKDLEKSVQEYFNDNSISFSFDDSDLVLYKAEDNRMLLSYKLTILGKQVIIDANTAEILMTTDLYLQDMVVCQYKDEDKDGTFQGIKLSENEYQIGDEEKGIFVFNANYKPMYKDVEDDRVRIPENSLPIISKDRYFGNNDSFAPEEYSKAVDLLNVLGEIANYYNELNAYQNTSVLVTMNNSYDPDNAYGGYSNVSDVTSATIPYEKEKIIGINFGAERSKDIYANIDVLGHEYMHGIFASYFYSDKDEAVAVDEGYADIFGEIIESLINEKTPNWIHGRRNIADPEGGTSKFPASIKYLEEAETFIDAETGTLAYRTYDGSGTDFYHFASTIISHSAYLMYNGIDGTSDRKINLPELGELWYKSLQFLQYNGDFSQCRNAVELAARCMLKNKDLTEEQYKTVITAFEMVGIKNASYTYSEILKNKFDLSVLTGAVNVNNVYVEYKLEVIKLPAVKIGPIQVSVEGLSGNWIWDKNSVEKPELVMKKDAVTGRQALNLKDGIYALRLTDINDSKNQSKSIDIKIIVDGEKTYAKDELVVNTDFTPVIVVVLNDNSSDEVEAVPDSGVISGTTVLLSKNPFVDNKNEFNNSFNYAFNTVEEWNGATVTDFPSEMNGAFSITGDFDHDGMEDVIWSRVEFDEGYNRFQFFIATHTKNLTTDVCPNEAVVDVYAYIIKGESEDYLVRESIAKRFVASDGDDSTDDYYLYESILVYGIKSMTVRNYEYFCNKQNGGYKFTSGGSGIPERVIYQSWDNADSENLLCSSPEQTLEYIKSELNEYGLSERVAGDGTVKNAVIPICSINKTMNTETQGTIVLCTNGENPSVNDQIEQSSDCIDIGRYLNENGISISGKELSEKLNDMTFTKEIWNVYYSRTTGTFIESNDNDEIFRMEWWDENIALYDLSAERSTYADVKNTLSSKGYRLDTNDSRRTWKKFTNGKIDIWIYFDPHLATEPTDKTYMTYFMITIYEKYSDSYE